MRFQPGFRFRASQAAAANPLLDDYPTAVAAYSFRKLRTAYAGSAVRIRESGGNTEADIGFDINGDFDTAAAATHIGANSGFIVTWYDQSGNGFNIDQTTAGNQPTYSATQLNSLPAMGFTNAADKHLRSAVDELDFGSASPDFTIAYVGSFENTSDSNTCAVSLWDNDGGAQDWNRTDSMRAIAKDAGENLGAWWSGSFRVGTAFTYATNYNFGMVFDGTDLKSYVNGSLGTSATLAVALDQLLQLGVGIEQAGSPNAGYTGNGGELVIWAADQTANMAGIDTNIGTYWGV
jgi:hypothetical protein